MKVEELMTHSVRTCRSGDTLSTAAQLMWDGDCGCVPVISDDGGVACFDCHLNGHTNAATHLVATSGPRSFAIGSIRRACVASTSSGCSARNER